MPADVLVNIRTVGAENVRAAKIELDALGASGGGVGQSFERLSGAFESLERREPSMALRRTVGAIEGLAASAVGASSELGRLGGAFALLFGGTGVGIVALGVLAGLGAAVAAFGTSSRDAAADVAHVREEIAKLNTEGAKLGASAQLFGTGAKTGFWHQFFGGEEQGRGLLEVQSEQQAKLTAFTQQMIKSFGSVEAAPKALRDRFQELYSQLKATSDLVDALKAKLAGLHDTERERGVSQRDVLEYMREGDYDRLVGRRAQPAALQAAITRFPALLRAPRGGIQFAEQEGVGRGIEEFRQAGLAPGMGPARFSAAAAIGAGVGALGQAAQGDAGGTISGIGALAATVPGGQIPGAVIAGLGGLVSLFHRGQARVSISRLEEEAMKQMREVMQVPQVASVNIAAAAGTDPRAIRYAQDRFDALGGVKTIPT